MHAHVVCVPACVGALLFRLCGCAVIQIVWVCCYSDCVGVLLFRLCGCAVIQLVWVRCYSQGNKAPNVLLQIKQF